MVTKTKITFIIDQTKQIIEQDSFYAKCLISRLLFNNKDLFRSAIIIYWPTVKFDHILFMEANFHGLNHGQYAQLKY